MTVGTENIDPLLCPICKKNNACINTGCADVNKTCWCNDPDIKFPEGLLQQIPPEARRRACICKECALSYQESQQQQ